MSSKRTAEGTKKTAPLTGERPFKQTKLNFGSFASPRPRQEQRGSTTAPSPPSTTTEEYEQDHETQPARKRRPAGPRHSLGKENRTPISPVLPPPPPNQPLLRITDIKGDIFTTTPHRPTLLIHAVNCLGSWGGGIALAFKKQYLSSFKIYASHCRQFTSSPSQLLGTALLIPPQKGDGKGNGNHWIGCLFTSVAYGRSRDSPGKILGNTAPAMGDLMKQVGVVMKGKDMDTDMEIRMCQVNSGLFDVPWEETKRVIGGMDGEEWDGDGYLERGFGELPVEVFAYWR